MDEYRCRKCGKLVTPREFAMYCTWVDHEFDCEKCPECNEEWWKIHKE